MKSSAVMGIESYRPALGSNCRTGLAGDLTVISGLVLKPRITWRRRYHYSVPLRRKVIQSEEAKLTPLRILWVHDALAVDAAGGCRRSATKPTTSIHADDAMVPKVFARAARV